MPDLDQLLDALAADVSAGTRAPGAPAAIKRARRRRAKVAVAAAGAMAFIAVGGGWAAGTLGGGDRLSPIGEPTTPSPTAMNESAVSTPTPTPTPTSATPAAELHALVAQVPGWAMTNTLDDEYDYAFNGRCSGDWTKGAISGGDGGVAGNRGELSSAGHGHAGFSSDAQAADAAARFAANLGSCTAAAWRTQPIAKTGAVLASSDHAVAWIQVGHREVHVLQLDTTDGPPPLRVQVAVAEWLSTLITEQNAD